MDDEECKDLEREQEEALARMNPKPVVWPGQSESGVDLTLLVQRLRLTPTERLECNRGGVEFIAEAKRARTARRAKIDGGTDR